MAYLSYLQPLLNFTSDENGIIQYLFPEINYFMLLGNRYNSFFI